MADPTLDLKSATVLSGQLGHLNVAALTDVMGVWRGAAGAQKIGDVQVVSLTGHARLFWGGTAGGGVNAQTLVTAGMPPGGLIPGDQLRWICNAINTGAVTVAIDGGTPIPVTARDATPLQGYELTVGLLADGVYDGTRIRLLNDVLYTPPRQALSGAATAWLAIPPRVQEIMLWIQGMSSGGSSGPIVQLGTTAGYVAAGYSGRVESPGNGTFQHASGATLCLGWANSYILTGWLRLRLVIHTTNRWQFAGIMGRDTVNVSLSQTFGYVDLPGPLDRLRITTGGGTDTFDGGNANLIGE